MRILAAVATTVTGALVLFVAVTSMVVAAPMFNRLGA